MQNSTNPRAVYRAPESGSRLWNRYFCLIILMSCAVNFGNFFMGSAYSLWIVDMGGSNATYGTIHSIYSLLVLIARPITGWVIDHGNRKRAFLLSSLVFASAMVLMLYSPVFGVFVAMRFIQGVGNGCAITICNTSAYDFMPPDKMDKGIGYVTLFSSLISALTATASVATYNRSGPGALVAFSAAALIAGMVLSYFIVFRQPVEQKKFRLKEVFNLSGLFEKRSLKPALLAAFSVNMAFGLRSYIILYGRSLGFSNPGWFTTISALGLLAVRFILDRLPTTEKSPSRRIYFAYGVLILYLVLLSSCRNLIMYFGAALMWSVIYGVLTPQLQSMAIRSAPAERRGAASSTFFCSTDIGIIIGSYMGGIIADHFSYRAMFASALIPVALCVLFYTFFMGGLKKKEKETKNA